MDKKIQKIRTKIDAVDDAMLSLLAQRAELVIAMKQAKGGANIYRPSREADILNRVVRHNNSQFPDKTIRAIFTEIVTGGRNLEEKLRVAYLGPEASYSHEAAIRLFGSQSDFLPRLRLTDVVAAVERGEADVAMLPIENSSEGSVAETLQLLRRTPLRITGEITMPIVHCIMSHAPSLTAIKQVVAHPQALGQCRAWLQLHVPDAELVSATSNSAAAALAKKNSSMAAIASEKAAGLFDVPILHRSIQDEAQNTTRFIVLGKTETQSTGNDKTSIICTAHNKPGALHELLGIFLKHGVNLLALTSHPEPDGDYAFYIDFEGHSSDTVIRKVLDELAESARQCIIKGSYPRSNNGAV